MKPQHLLLVVPLVEAYMAAGPRSTFLGASQVSHPSTAATRSSFRMDTERSDIDPVALYNVEKTLRNSIQGQNKISLRDAEKVHGLPWKSSIDPNVEDDELLYMPFWEWQMKFMEDNLTDLQVAPCHNGKTDFSYNVNTKKKARIGNLCASSKEYRKIRMTYYDAGDNTQVFNSVWYPDPAYNLPVLGIDLLAFNRKKYLAIVDFQPLHQDEEDHSQTYEHLLQPIKDKYDSLKGRMSSKFYDETQFFSQQMLFARFEDESVVENDLFPAFKSYVQTHLDLVRSTEAKPEDMKMVLELQKEYDTYSAERDPATGLFAAMYGAEWADEFVYDFLFSMSEKRDGPPPAMPFMGGPPQGAAKKNCGGNPYAQPKPQAEKQPVSAGRS
jgi:15,16-dihydrobiliverdin:ferredoxin oxidoreductase